MNNLLAYTESEAIRIYDEGETNSGKEPLKTFEGLSQERINSFLREPSVEPDEVEENTDARANSFKSQSRPVKNESPIALVPKTIYSPRTFSSLQKWEGYVIETNDDYFLARITDLSEDHEDEEIEVMYTEISDDDKELVRPGAIFYWHIGYETEKGTVKRSSIIRFRRLPKWTESDTEKAKDFEKRMKLFLNL